MSQHHSGIAAGVLSLLYDAGIYTKYLGEDNIWALYCDILEIITQFNPEYMPWHNITDEEDRPENNKQVIMTENLDGEEISPIVGAGMADELSSINHRYETGFPKLWKAIVDMAGFECDGKTYISDDTQLLMDNLFQVSDHYLMIIMLNYSDYLFIGFDQGMLVAML